MGAPLPADNDTIASPVLGAGAADGSIGVYVAQLPGRAEDIWYALDCDLDDEPGARYRDVDGTRLADREIALWRAALRRRRRWDHVARAVHLLGGDALAVFPVGGMSGEMLCRLLASEDVPHSAVPIAGITRESLAVVERQSGKQFRFLLPGPPISVHDQERCLDTLAAYAAESSYLVASGSLPPGVPADFYARVARLARDNDLRFVLDTSGPALAAAGNGIFLLKTSLRELEELTGAEIRTEREEESAAQAIIATGLAEILVVSLGARGALLATDREVCRFAAIPVAALGSVGAGDSMVAGIVLGLARGWKLIEAVKFGMAAGAAALLRPGTELCRREDTERLYQALPPA